MEDMMFLMNENIYIDFNSLKEIVEIPKSTLQRELNKINPNYIKYKNMYLYEIKSLNKNIIKYLNNND